jgi:hypothetical protein
MNAHAAPRKQAMLAVLLIVGACATLAAEFKTYRAHVAVAQAAPVAAPTNMVDILKQCNDRLDPVSLDYLNDQRADIAGRLLAQQTTLGDKMKVEDIYASELLKAGRSEQALREYLLLESQISNLPPNSNPRLYLYMQKAVAYMRIGEQQNCCASNNSDSCLVPISGKGIHTKQYGSRHAIACLTQVLKANPKDTTARWLINIAYMTIGGYPNNVPKPWLIPPKAYGAEYPMKKFYNAAPDLGLDVLGLAGGAIMEDFEGNGLLDIMVSTIKVDGQMQYFHNNGDGTFTDRTKEAGLIGEVGGINMITTDYNNDGRPDVIVLRGGWFGKNGNLPLSLLRNDGNGHFTDVTLQAGLLTFGPCNSAVAFDYNGDGLLDLFVAYESTPGDPHPCKLFRNDGNGTFTDVTAQCGLNITKFVKAVISADYNHSGRPSLYLSCQGGPNILLRNDGPAGPDKSPTAPWKFTDVSSFAGVSGQHNSFSCFFFDYNNDGWPDIYVNGFGASDVGQIANDYLGLPSTAERARLYRNNHDGTFTDVTKQVHLYRVVQGMGSNYGDLDNDGWPDIFAGTGNPDFTTLLPKRVFHNCGGKYFAECTTTGNFGHLQKGHGVSFGDLNNNGQMDVFMKLGGAYTGDTAHSALWINPGNNNKWVTLKLEGVRSNRIAIGAEICVTVSTPHGDRKIYDTVSTGGSFGVNPLRQHIGLGDATAIKQVAIHWPASGINQVVKNLTMDNFYHITEGDPNAELLHYKTFALPTGSPTGEEMAGMKMPAGMQM